MKLMLEIAKAFHAKHIAPLLGQPAGASPDEVTRLEGRLGHELPQAYREYLLWMGRDVEGIFRGSCWFISDVQYNAKILQGLLEKQGCSYSIKASHVVFFSHQGYMAAWFDAASGDADPEVWFMDDDMNEPRHSGRFTEALLDDMTGLAGCMSA